MTDSTTGPTELLEVGWCHQCGTVQLKAAMPTEWLEWSESTELVCVTEGCDEPWGMGVWRKGRHQLDCDAVAAARERVVDWTPVLEGCGCPA